MITNTHKEKKHTTYNYKRDQIPQHTQTNPQTYSKITIYTKTLEHKSKGKPH